MGRAIDQDNRLDGHDSKLRNHEKRLELIEDALEELVQTKVHHVDLHDFEPDADELSDNEEFTPPAGKRKKTTKVEKSNTKAEKSSAEA